MNPAAEGATGRPGVSDLKSEGWTDRAIRGVGAYAKPALSVIVTASSGNLDWNTSLASVVKECAWLGAELIVVQPCEATVDPTEFPYNVRMVRAPADASGPQLRRLGMAAASGDIITMLDGPPIDARWASGLLSHLGHAPEPPERQAAS